MGYNFPNSPTSGQTYTPAGGPTFSWNGNAWQSVQQGVPVTVYVSETPPVSPAPGQLWFNSTNGNMCIWYVDPDSAQWVQVSGAVSAVGTALPRNRIVNPSMQIAQETTGVVGSGGYAADQWLILSSLTVGAIRAGSSGGYTYVHSYSTAKPALAVSDYGQIYQRIEGLRVSDFLWGTASGKSVVLRFEAYAGVPGLYTVVVTNTANNWSFIKGINLTSTLQTFVIPITAPPSGGTWPIDNSASMTVRFVTCAGTALYGTDNVWQNNGQLGVPGMANLASVASTNFGVTNVGLYLDPDKTGRAPPWDIPDEAQELAACQRYFETSYDRAATIGGASSSFRQLYFTAGIGQGQFPIAVYTVRKRVTPAVAIYPSAGGASGNVTGVTTGLKVVNLEAGSETSIAGYLTGPSSDLFRWHYVASARL